MSGPSDVAHLTTLTDRFGTFEHAEYAIPRRHHGYCTDDVARVLVVTAREPDPTPEVSSLAHRSLRFLGLAQSPTGTCRNRRSATGRWEDDATVEDCWGRSLWAFGTAAAHPDAELADEARRRFALGATQRSPWSRATAFAMLGAAAIAATQPGHDGALSLLDDGSRFLSALATDAASVTSPGWAWPEPRLSYANAAVPEALMAAGHALGDPSLLARGLELLDWLLRVETRGGHLSVTPAGGLGPDDLLRPADLRFDQQPIEVAAMADACGRAFDLTGSPAWAHGLEAAAAWFDGDNDAGIIMWDPSTGGGFDGLERRGANQNQGAESTLALISTRQQLRRRAVAAA